MGQQRAIAMPWLSVLVPVYGVERYLEACVESVCAQADEGVEVMLLDDASSDRSGQIAAMLQARHPRHVQLLRHVRNRGIAATRNDLLAAAHGRHVWFLDSDDELQPGAIAGLRAIVEAEAPDLVLCDFSLLRDRHRLRDRLRGEHHRRSHAAADACMSTDRDALVAGLLQARQMHAWSKIATREAWQRVRFPEGRYFEDIAVIPQLVGGIRSWRRAPRPWVGYRQRDGSILATLDAEKIRDELQALQDLHAGLVALPGGLDRDARAALEYFCLRAFASLARKLPADMELEASCRDAMRMLFPHGVDSVLRLLTRRGWWFRAARARRSLARRGWLQ